MMKTKRIKRVIGRSERIDLPEWNIRRLRTKVDTGARTSSLDVDHIQVLSRKKVRFNVVLAKGKINKNTQVTARISRISHVKSSPIHKEERIFVKTPMKLGPVTKDIEINLVDRSNMVYRMLLGRSALKHDFIVDVEHAGLLTKRKKLKSKGGRK